MGDEQRNLDRRTVTVIGAGSFGSALASVAAANGHSVTLVARRQDVVDEINTAHRNERYLPGVNLDPHLVATTGHDAVWDSDLVLLAVPSHAMRETCRRIHTSLTPRAVVVHATKGLETGSRLRMSDVIFQELPELERRRLAILTGPSHAEEVSRGMPTTLVVASLSRGAAEYVQDALMNRALRLYTNPDVIGSELGGALKNIIALGCGISDGLLFGDNARAAIMTRGLVEIARLGVRLGAAYSTFSGLTGVGDLIVTCTSRHSRNWNTGYLLGKGVSLQEALDRVGMAVEGIRTTQVALELATQVQAPMPIASAIGDILFHGKSPGDAVGDLMGRTRTHEMEEYVQDSTASWEYE